MTEEEVIAEAAIEEAEAWDRLAWAVLGRDEVYESEDSDV